MKHDQKVSLIFVNSSVPSRGPSNLRLSNLQASEVKVQWDPLPQQYANGRLLGYSVYVYEYGYYANYVKTIYTDSSGVHFVIVRGLKAAQRYRISVAAFTSKGVGPQSYYSYITTGAVCLSLCQDIQTIHQVYSVPEYLRETYIEKAWNTHADTHLVLGQVKARLVLRF